jgi:hypothetical protein
VHVNPSLIVREKKMKKIRKLKTNHQRKEEEKRKDQRLA